MEIVGILSERAEMEGILSVQHVPDTGQEEPILEEPVLQK